MPIGPPFYSMLEDEELVASHPDWGVILEQLNTREMRPQCPEAYNDPISNALASIFAGEMSVEDALADAQAQIDPDPDYMKLGVWGKEDWLSK